MAINVIHQLAQQAIDRKRAQLGALVGSPISDLQPVESAFEAFVQHFDKGLDIYFSAGDTEAHEVHGDIKRKYDIVAPDPNKGLFGLPITDESPATNGGRFNDFSNGHSIYWHPAIGPRVVKEPIRALWKQEGGEGGRLGYPVIDLKQWPTANPATDPPLLWSTFQNGAIVQTTDPPTDALVANIPADKLSQVVHKQFDVEIHKSPDNVGLDPGISIVSVSEWSSDLIESAGRVITYKLSGFRDNGLLQDTTFVFDIGLRFRLQMEQVFGSPSVGTLVAEMAPGSLVVQAFGLGDSQVQARLQDAILAAFQQPRVVAPNIPVSDANGPQILDLLVTPKGDMQFLINPLPTVIGNLRQLFIQRAIDEQVLPSLLG
jgi:LGFP repeat-containing protein